MIYNLKTTWPTKISVPFLSSLDSLLYDTYIICVDNFNMLISS